MSKSTKKAKRKNKAQGVVKAQPGLGGAALGGAAAAVAAAPLAVTTVDVSQPVMAPVPLVAMSEADSEETMTRLPAVEMAEAPGLAASSARDEQLEDDAFTSLELEFFSRADELYAEGPSDSFDDLVS